MNKSWHFHAVRSNNAFGFRWIWRYVRTDGSSVQSLIPRDYYYDCIQDAREQGYRGPFPAGPKAALDALPEFPVARAPDAQPQDAEDSETRCEVRCVSLDASTVVK